jgi:hypothetical protein
VPENVSDRPREFGPKTNSVGTHATANVACKLRSSVRPLSKPRDFRRRL